ncbi:MAG: sigma-70 family RNA polymerase sigma factor [Planctomycetes bacterium]|nr:sigma-70 family RNA polymerase sigma factor [Planctomycetota bacterium]
MYRLPRGSRNLTADLRRRRLATSESTAQRFTAQDPDVRLMLQVRDDNAGAFEELMLRYQNRLVSLLAHLVGRRDLGEDLAQDVFLRVYRARKRYVPGSKFSTWLYTIANNVASNARRGMARRKEVNLVNKDSGEMGGNPLDAAALAASRLMPTRQLDKAELREVVKLAISALNERQRMAVLLNKFEHLSYEEIAEIMHMSPAAIKSLLSRARSNLRDVLEPYLQDGAPLDI